MAAYAALVSVTHIVDQIKHHPRSPVYLPLDLVESLTENVTFLQGFLEGYSLQQAGYNDEADPLEVRIASVAYAAEDVIESYIVAQILGPGSTSSVDFYACLHEVIVELEAIKRSVLETIEVQYLPSDSSIGSSSVAHNTPMVGFDDVLLEVLDKLISTRSSLQILPIVGMGGIGKTTLVQNLYSHPIIREHFDCVAWATISQEFNTREILKAVFSQVNKEAGTGYSSDDYQIGERLHRHLFGRRYLIVLDDMWSVEAWDELRRYFPDNENGSRIIITTRLSNLAYQVTGSLGFQMKFLEDNISWDLLRQIVFGENDCPVALVDIGKMIAKNCKGLPLSLVVIGGLLARHRGTREYWEHILENTSLAVSLEDDERCLQILYTSYKELPVYLKPCFLYLGIYHEDSEIRVCELVRLWVAEGFLKPIDLRSLEVVAEEYLMELVHRNVIIVHKLGSNGKTKLCKMHDIVRDLCLREAHKQKFLCVRRPHDLCRPECVINTERRIIIHGSKAREQYDPAEVLYALQSASLARSLIITYKSDDFENVIRKANHKLLRVYKVDKTRISSNTRSFYLNHKLCNLRYFSTEGTGIHVKLSGGIYWNLQTLIAQNMSMVRFTEIWQMYQLRCVKLKYLSLPDPPSDIKDEREKHFSLTLSGIKDKRDVHFSLPDPPSGIIDERDYFALRNLQLLSEINISNFRENVVARIPNIKKLRIRIDDGESPDYFNNLRHLLALQHLNCQVVYLETAITLPWSLKKLTLQGCNGLSWEDLTTMIGPLPYLEILKLEWISAVGTEWVTAEGHFCSLKFLLIQHCADLERWTTEGEHFPRLEHLLLKYLDNLEEIPLSIGGIDTLQSIELEWCSDSAEASARTILAGQRELANEYLRVVIMAGSVSQE